MLDIVFCVLLYRNMMEIVLWKFLLAAGIVVPARWIFLVQELISVISWILLEC